MSQIRHTFRPPFDVDGILRFLAARAIPGVEQVSGNTYVRSFRRAGQPSILSITADQTASVLVSEAGEDDDVVASRVEDLFDLAHDPSLMISSLSQFPRLAPLVRRNPGVRVPGAWDPFELCVRAIIGQQISVAGARTILGRIAERYGDALPHPIAEITVTFPTPARLADADLELVGITRARSSTVRDVARLFAEHEYELRCGKGAMTHLLPELSSIRGIGPWTLGYVAMRGNRDRDAYPAGDLVLRKALGESRPVSARELATRSEQWSPWRAYATILLWNDAANIPKAEPDDTFLTER